MSAEQVGPLSATCTSTAAAAALLILFVALRELSMFPLELKHNGCRAVRASVGHFTSTLLLRQRRCSSRSARAVGFRLGFEHEGWTSVGHLNVDIAAAAALLILFCRSA